MAKIWRPTIERMSIALMGSPWLKRTMKIPKYIWAIPYEIYCWATFGVNFKFFQNGIFWVLIFWNFNSPWRLWPLTLRVGHYLGSKMIRSIFGENLKYLTQFWPELFQSKKLYWFSKIPNISCNFQLFQLKFSAKHHIIILKL